VQEILARFDDSVLVLNERIRNSTPAGNSLSFEQRELITMQRRTVLSDALESFNANFASGFTRLENLVFSEALTTRPVLAEMFLNLDDESKELFIVRTLSKRGETV
jgi:hypothetical protein